MNLDPMVVAAAKRLADGLLERLDDAVAVVVATEDGFDVASARRGTVDAARMAAMASAIAAIGEVISREAALGRTQSMVVEAETGFLVMRSAVCHSVGLVITTQTSRNGLLGLTLHAVAEATRTLQP